MEVNKQIILLIFGILVAIIGILIWWYLTKSGFTLSVKFYALVKDALNRIGIYII